MLPEALRQLRFPHPGDVSASRRGTRHTCALMEDIAHDKITIETLLAVSNLDFDLYAHAIEVACVQYYRLVSAGEARAVGAPIGNIPEDSAGGDINKHPNEK